MNNPLRDLAASRDYGYRVVVSPYLTKTVVVKQWFTTGELILRALLCRWPFRAYREVTLTVASDKAIINDQDRVIMCHPMIYDKVMKALKEGRI